MRTPCDQLMRALQACTELGSFELSGSLREKRPVLRHACRYFSHGSIVASFLNYLLVFPKYLLLSHCEPVDPIVATLVLMVLAFCNPYWLHKGVRHGNMKDTDRSRAATMITCHVHRVRNITGSSRLGTPNVGLFRSHPENGLDESPKP